MFGYRATPDRSGEILAAGMTSAAQTQARSFNQLGDNIGAALEMIGAVYDKERKRRQELAGMTSAVGLMKDVGAIDQDTLEKFNNAPMEARPMLFNVLQAGPWKTHLNKQLYQAQAQAWGDYRAGEPRNRYGYEAGADSFSFGY
jgi:hypothetical protein